MRKIKKYLWIIALIIVIASVFIVIYKQFRDNKIIDIPEPKIISNEQTITVNPTPTQEKRADTIIGAKSVIFIPNKKNIPENIKNKNANSEQNDYQRDVSNYNIPIDEIPKKPMQVIVITDKNGETIREIETTPIITETEEGIKIETEEVKIAVDIIDSPIKIIATHEFDIGIGYTLTQFYILNKEFDIDAILTPKRIGVGLSTTVYRNIYFGIAGTYDFYDKQLEPVIYLSLRLRL